MASLIDLLSAAQRAEKITILGHEFDVRALELGEVAMLLHRFPALGSIFSDETPMAGLVEAAPGAIGVLIAMGTGHAGDVDQEAAATRLPIDIQIEIAGAVLRQTAPGGAIPLFARAVGLLSGAGASPNGKGQASAFLPPQSG